VTKLERRIADLATATGKIVAVGRQGHKDEWFAHSDGVEVGGPTAGAALEALVDSLAAKADSTRIDLEAAVRAQARLRALAGERRGARPTG